MYVPEFWAGVVTTILIEIIALVVIGITWRR